MYKYDRTTQSTMLSMITDTSFRINGDRLFCPHCPNEELSLEHVLSKCHIYQNERRDAYHYTDKKNKKDVLISTDLFPNFCCAARDKIYNTVSRTRQVYNENHSQRHFKLPNVNNSRIRDPLLCLLVWVQRSYKSSVLHQSPRQQLLLHRSC